jgi:RNA polymerase sigma-70 factor (ECF subfamily)
MLLDRVLERLKVEHVQERKSLMFEELKGTLELGRDVPYTEIARRLDVSPGAVKVMVHRLRKRYRELLRDEVAQTVGEPSQVDQELRNLVEILRR